MFAVSERWKMILILVLLVSVAGGSLHAATIDPLLKTMMRDKDSGAGIGLAYENFLVVDSSSKATDPIVGVILHLEGSFVDLSEVPGLLTGTQIGDFVTARLPLSSLPWLEADQDIAHVEAAHLLHPTMNLARVEGRVEEVWAGEPAYLGAGVLVGVVDSGIDWSHEDFQTAANQTRIKYIWDQFATGTPPAGYDYGVQYTEAQINSGSVSGVDLSGHGTHVTGIAAGNGRAATGYHAGVAPEADIIFVKAFDDDLGGFPEDKTIAAIGYLADKAEELGQPMAINMSLGGHMGAHDGTSAQEQIIDELSTQGVVFCIAAGNDGEKSVHDSSAASGSDLVFNVANYGNTSRDFILVDIWVDGPNWPSVSVTFNGQTTGPAASGAREDGVTTHGTIILDNATGGTYPSGSKRIIIQIDDQNGSNPGIGNWTITLSGGSGTAHAWMAYSTMTAGFPGSDQSYSVTMPGTAEEAITVAAHKTRHFWMALDGGNYAISPDTDMGDHAPFSSYGPTRDDREKPDISAPGLSIAAPYSTDTRPVPSDASRDPTGKYFLSQGTSMASPFVCGVVALMLEKNRTLDAQQIKAALRTSAAHDAYTGAGWNNAFGAGKVDALAAVQAIPGLGPPPTGDVNADELTTVQDLVVLVNHIIDPDGHPLDVEARAQGDVYPAVSGDGLLNASDLARIVGFILESDQPGYSKTGGETVLFETAEALWQDGRWWQPVNITGSDVVAGQFVLEIGDVVWQPEDLVCEADVHVVAGAFGSRLRVLLYDFSGHFPVEGITVLVPFEFSGVRPGQARAAGILMADASGSPLDVQEKTARPMGFLNITPNPAPGDVMVSFYRNGGRSYQLSVFNLRGQRVRGIRQGQGEEGMSNAIFNGRDDSGRVLPAGVYFVRLSSEDGILTQKVVLTR